MLERSSATIFEKLNLQIKKLTQGAAVYTGIYQQKEPGPVKIFTMLGRLSLGEKKVLVLTDGVKENVYLSGRNLPLVQVLPYSDVSAYHVLWSDVVMIEGPAIGHTLSPVADTEAAPSAKSAAAKKKAAKPAKAAKAEKKPAAKKAAAPKAKKAAKKPAAKAKKPASKPKKKGK